MFYPLHHLAVIDTVFINTVIYRNLVSSWPFTAAPASPPLMADHQRRYDAPPPPPPLAPSDLWRGRCFEGDRMLLLVFMRVVTQGGLWACGAGQPEALALALAAVVVVVVVVATVFYCCYLFASL